jgi:glucosyl-3-phosphoglycerate synthase
MRSSDRLIFPSLRDVVVPIFGDDDHAALSVAKALGSQITLVGVVALPEGESLSAGAKRAQTLRRTMRKLSAGVPLRRSEVRVSHSAWNDLKAYLTNESPDLFLIDYERIASLGASVNDVLAQTPCDIALIRGSIAERPNRVIAAMRGGPYAELALRIGLELEPKELVALNVKLKGNSSNDSAFRGLANVLARMPEVQKHMIETDDAAHAILDEAANCDLLVMGASARSLHGGSLLGPVTERALWEAKSSVMIVKTKRPMSEQPDEVAGAGAISILVDKWFAENTFQADEFADIRSLVKLKEQQGLTVSLALPALNEQETVGEVIRTIKRALMDKTRLLDEIVLIDSDSTDRTRSIAKKLGVPVFVHQELLAEFGARNGKGDALWKSLFVTKGDIVAWIDTDIANIHPRFVYGIVGPLLANSHVQFVKGFYRRPLKVGNKMQAGGGGRVTELTARPLLNLFYPELSGVVQPLSGEYAGRRSALEQCTFSSGYGVEISLLIDIFEKFGLPGIAQVDLLERVHHNKTLEALSKMSFAIIQTVMRKLERHYERSFIADVNKTMKLIRSEGDSYFLDVEEIAERDRPPMIELEVYRKLHQGMGAQSTNL